MEDGAVQAMLAYAFPARAATFVGAPGGVTANGVTVLLGAEKVLDPTAFVASTWNW